MSRLAALALALAACGPPPPFDLRFRITQGPEESCIGDKGTPAASCADVTMLCKAYVSIRILDPNDPTAPYISVCKLLVGKQDLCSIAGVDLPQPLHPIQAQKLEVQIAVFPEGAITFDGNANPICPTDVQFTATGFPATVQCPDADPTNCPVVPAVGGRAFYHPGDTETVVNLGCSDPAQLTDPMKCGGVSRIAVTATIDDFDTEVSVSPATADGLAVAVGEPLGAELKLEPLARTVIQPIPTWGGDIDLKLMQFACLEVFEEVAQSTAALTCAQFMPPKATIDLPGIRLAKSSLDQILATLNTPQFPPQGLVVGIVLDDLGNPAPNFVVTTSDPGAHIEYLSANRRNIITGGTSSSGVFVSTDAPFGTMFTTHDSVHTGIGYGGLVANKVSIVVLQLNQPTVGN